MGDIKNMGFFSTVRYDFCAYKNRLGHNSIIKSIVLIFFFNFGFQLIFLIRLQELAGKLPIFGPMIKRVIWYVASWWTSTEISVAASFGVGVYFPHPVGIVIGDTWDIGDDVVIMQGVTLGRKDRSPPKGRSLIKSGATICAGAVVVGEVTIGEAATVGANAVVLSNIPPNATAVGAPARILNPKSAKHLVATGE